MQGSLRRTGIFRGMRNRHIVVKLVETTLKGNLSLDGETLFERNSSRNRRWTFRW